MSEDASGFSIVIPTYNRCAVMERTLRHLLAQDYPSDRFEVLVVDNSTDDTPAMVRALEAETGGRVRLQWMAERLPAVKRNRGLDAARFEFVLFMNDDVWVEPDFLHEHARTHRAHAPDPVAVLGYVRQSPEMPPTPFTRFYQPFAYAEIADRADRAVTWQHFWSMNLSVPRDVAQSRNLVFHEDWAEIGNEDVELGYRWTVRAGLPAIYNPRARGDHFHPHTLASSGRVQAAIGRGLRDLEVLIPEPGLLERYGVFSWRNSPRAVARGLARRMLFNRFTVPPLERYLDRSQRSSPVTTWMYWKVLLHHTNAGYRSAPARHPQPLAVRPPIPQVVRS